MSLASWWKEFTKPLPPPPTLRYLDRVKFKGGFYKDALGMVIAEGQKQVAGPGMNYQVTIYKVKVGLLGPEVWVRPSEVDVVSNRVEA